MGDLRQARLRARARRSGRCWPSASCWPPRCSGCWCSRTGGGCARCARCPRRDVALAPRARRASATARRRAATSPRCERLDASLLSLLLYTFPAMVTVGRDRARARAGEPADRRRPRRSPRPASCSCWRARARARSTRSAPRSGSRAAVVYTTYILTSDGVAARVGPLALSALVCTGAAATLTRRDRRRRRPAPRRRERRRASAGWRAIAVVSTVGADRACSSPGCGASAPTTASILSTAEPVTTVVLAFLVFGESLGPVQLVGGALVLGAVFVLSVPVRGSPARAPPTAVSVMSDALKGKVALVAGATRGAGRGIAVALGEAGATVYCTGARPASAGRSTTGRRRSRRPPSSSTPPAAAGSPSRSTTCEPDRRCRALVARIDGEQGRLDVLVNDIWGGEQLVEWDAPIWEHDLDDGLRLLRLAIDTHLITSHFALPLLIRRPGGLVVEMTDGTLRVQRGQLPAVDLLRPGQDRGDPARVRAGARARAARLHRGGADARLDALGDDARALRRHRGQLARRRRSGAARTSSRSPRRRASSAARSPRWPPTPTCTAGTAGSFSSGGLAREYGFTDLDGTQPDCWRYLVEVQDAGLPPDPEGYR